MSVFRLTATNYRGPRPVWDLPWVKSGEPCVGCGQQEVYVRLDVFRCYACGQTNERRHVAADSREVWPNGEVARRRGL